MSISGKRKLLLAILLGAVFCFWLAQEVLCKNVVLKTVIINPSKTKVQKATLKAYLPKEAAPKDVVALGDLKIDYDIDKELYYVFKEFELQPGEGIRRSIEIKDIWVIPEEDIDSFNKRAQEFVDKLKRTKYAQEAKALRDNIKVKSDKIIADQTEALDTLPQVHIAAYRINMVKLNSIKDDLAALDEMLLKNKLAAASSVFGGKFSVKVSWWVITGVIIALGVISFVFFIIWHHQAGIKGLEEKAEDMELKEKPLGGSEEEKKEE